MVVVMAMDAAVPQIKQRPNTRPPWLVIPSDLGNRMKSNKLGNSFHRMLTGASHTRLTCK